ncbi:C6 transcription factor [Phyllosticta capitalensis]
MAHTSPTNGSHFAQFHHNNNSPPTPRHGVKRSQSAAGFESSPGSQHDDDDQSSVKKQAQKRACNECRQQKLKCDVVQDPFTPCSRCRKQNLTCQVSANFKRVGKRSRHAEMEREAIDLKARVKELEERETQLRQQLASLGVSLTPSSGFSAAPPPAMPAHDNNQPSMFQNFLGQQQQYPGGSHDEAVSSLVSLKHGFGGAYESTGRNHAYNLGPVYVTAEQAEDLFAEYFANYHPFLPLLDSTQSVETYMSQSKLLFWTILVVAARHYPKDRNFQDEQRLIHKLTPAYRALVWTNISEVPQNYHVVKALCLLCTWPLPASNTTVDETFMLSGVMMQVAMHHGLHQPSHAQDFSRTHVQLRDEEIKDRLSTWAVCNTVAHCVSVASGQPSTTLFDSALSFEHDHMDRLPESLVNHVMLERSAARITKALYSDSGSRSFYDDKSILISYETTNLNDLEARLRHVNFTGRYPEYFANPARQNTNLFISPTRYSTDNLEFDLLHLRAVRLNLQLYAFFNKQEHGWHQDLLNLLLATNVFLESIFSLDEAGSLPYTTNYVTQMMVASGFTLHRLLNSNFANTIPQPQLSASRSNFTRLINCIRNTSVRGNDLPQRLAEVLAQLWKASGSGNPKHADVEAFRSAHGGNNGAGDIQLKVRCRMSMSVVFDSLWHWREKFRGKVSNLDAAVANPTDPDTSSSTTPAPPGRGSNASVSGSEQHAPQASANPHLPTPLSASSLLSSVTSSAPTSSIVVPSSVPTSLDPNLPTLSLPTMNNSLSMGSADLSSNNAPAGPGPFADYTTDFFDPMSSILNDPIFFSDSGYRF